jgi:hypothetical protein
VVKEGNIAGAADAKESTAIRELHGRREKTFSIRICRAVILTPIPTECPPSPNYKEGIDGSSACGFAAARFSY